MHDENIHITPDPKKAFPQPEIPADEAWNKMADMLDAEMPAAPSNQASPSKPPSAPSGSGLLGTSWNFWGIIVGVVAIVGVLTWGILNLANKPQTSAVVHNNTKSAQNTSVSDSSTLTDQHQVLPQEKVRTPETFDNRGKMKSSLKTESSAEKNVQPVVASKQGMVSRPGTISQAGVASRAANESKNKQEPAVVAAVPVQGEAKPAAPVVVQPPIGNITAAKENIPVQQTVNETMAKDTLQLAKTPPQPLSSDTTSMKISDQPVTAGKVPSNPPGEANPGETVKTAGPEKSGKSKGMSENLSWHMDVSGNIGQVHQKGRDLNIFYGAMVTAGLWDMNLKGGIETGLGWEDYEDYGSVTNNIRITDSIPIDTLGNLQYYDTTRIAAYKYHYQYLQVPLFVSKQLVAAGKFSFDLKTGPLIGILISDKKTFDYNSGPVGGEILVTVNNDYSRLKISWQWQLMAQFKWNVSERISLTLSPYGIFYLNNLYDSKNRPADIPFGIGVYGGIIYRFK